MRDALGNELEVGDYLIMATRDGNSAGMRVCRIQEINPNSLKVKTAILDWGNKWRASTRANTLYKTSLIAKADPSCIPGAIRGLL